MDPTLIVTAVTSVLSLIETLLPTLGVTSASNTSLIDTIISSLSKMLPMLEELAPLVGSEISLLYTGVRNIVNNLSSSGVVTTAEQDAALDSLDATVDASWDKVSAQFDPDYVAPGPTPAAGS